MSGFGLFQRGVPGAGLARVARGVLALIFLLAGASPLCTRALAQSGKGQISGTVVDASGATVPGAQLQLAPLGVKVVSDAQGAYRLPEVPPGRYQLTVAYVGFASQVSDVELTAGQSLSLTLTLKTASASEEIIVSAGRPHGEAEAINETRSAENILQVLPAEVITSLPNANVADAIGRLPSVALYRIEGEGVYIQVRGTEPRLTNVTVDGITLPAPEPTVRQVRLDVIPSDMVEAIELNKTLSASQDANGIGGSVNLRHQGGWRRPDRQPLWERRIYQHPEWAQLLLVRRHGGQALRRDQAVRHPGQCGL